MDRNLKIALARVKELEEDLDAQAIRIELLLESVHELEEINRALKGQLQNLRLDRRYEVA